MSEQVAKLYIRVRLSNGRWSYAVPTYTATNKIRPLYSTSERGVQHHPEGKYDLRYKLAGKRAWELLGSDASLAIVAVQRKNHELQGKALGLEASSPVLARESSPTVEAAPKGYRPEGCRKRIPS